MGAAPRTPGPATLPCLSWFSWASKVSCPTKNAQAARALFGKGTLSLSPGQGHGGGAAMVILALVFRPIFEVGDESDQLLDGFFVSLAALVGGCQLGFAHDADLRVTARPGDNRRGPMSEQIRVIERTVFLVIAGK